MKNKALTFLLTFVLIFTFVSVPTFAGVKPSKDNCIGHRGAMDLAPHSTMACFQAAKDADYNKFECDVWYTNSKEFMICHDVNLKKQTGKNLDAWKLSTKNRKNYPIIHGVNLNKYPTQYYPTLDEALTFAKKNGMQICLHLKVHGKHTFSASALKKMNKIIQNHKLKKKPVVFSSNKDVVRRMKNYPWKQGYLNSSASWQDYISFAKANKCNYIIFYYSSSQKPTKAKINKAHKAGLKAIAYNINTASEANDIWKVGGDYCITNKVLW